jgi:hypothetical protein
MPTNDSEERLGYRPPTASERSASSEARGIQGGTDQVLVALDPNMQLRFNRTMRKIFLSHRERGDRRAKPG